MRIHQRLAIVVLAAVVSVGVIQPAGTARAAEPQPATTVPASGQRVPNPVMYVPEAGHDELAHRPEATIGFRSRDPLEPHVVRPDRKPATTSAAAPPESTSSPTPTPSSTPAPELRSPGAASMDPLLEVVPTPDSDNVGLQAEAAAQVTGVIEGIGGDPLDGATVCLDDIDGHPSCIAFATTSPNGSYAIDAPAGDYNVRAYDPTGIHVPGYWSPSGWKKLMFDAGVVSVVSSEVNGIDITLPLFPYIRGTVTNADGDPVHGMQVEGAFNSFDSTNSDGSYNLKVYPDSQSTIKLHYTPVYRVGWYSTSGFVTDEAEATAVSVASTDVTGIDVVVPTWPTVSGRVTDADGAPVPSSPVYLQQGASQIQATTDSDGQYLHYAVGGGAWHALFGTDDGPWIYQDIPVDADSDVTLDVVLHRHPVISGDVVDLDGNPVAGITVRVEGGNSTQATTTTDGNGHFSAVFKGQSPVRLYFQDPTLTYVNGALGSDGFTSTEPAASFAVGPDDELDVSVTIPQYVTLTGAVTLADGSPVAGGSVTARSPEGPWPTGAIEEDGSFAITLAPGSYSLVVPGGFYGREGFAYESGAVEPIVVGTEGRHVDVVLPAGRTISGTVTAGGAGRANIEVDVYLHGTPFTSTMTGPSGTYSVQVPPGAYLVGFFDPTGTYGHGWFGPSGYTSDPNAAKLVGVGATDATGVNVTLPSTRRISGKVRDKEFGTVIPFVFVEAFVNGVFYSAQYAGSTGSFNLPVAPGQVTLWMYDTETGHAPGWRTSTSLTARFANAAATTVGSSNVSGVTIHSPEAALLRPNVGQEPVPGSWHSVEGTVEAWAYGAAASFDMVSENGTRHMPVLKGTYLLWLDTTENDLVDGWYKSGTLTPDLGVAVRLTLTSQHNVTIKVPYGREIAGFVKDKDGYPIAGIDVQLFANGSYYTDQASNGSFSIMAPPGTYRLAFVDLFGMYRTGWLGPSGFVTTYESAKDVTVTAAVGAPDLSIKIPMDSPPATPVGVVATPYHESVLVTFGASPGSITRPIIHYAVTASPGGRQCISTVPSCMVSGLTNGTPYTFTVTASSIVGASLPSAATAAVSPHPVPDAPDDVTASADGSSVTVSWSEPADHGSPITGYHARVEPGGQSCTPSPADATSCTILAVGDGHRTVAVHASNAVGPGPDTTSPVTVDTAPPVVTAPVTVLRHGTTMTGTAVPVTVTWSASDSLTGVGDTSLEVATGSGAYVDRPLAGPTSTTFTGVLASSSSAHRLRDRASDGKGNVSGWATGPATYVTLRPEAGTGISYSGAWSTVSTSSALGGKSRYTTARNASVSYPFTGRGIAFVSRKNSASGKVAVYLDGTRVATVDLHASSTTVRWVAWSRMFSTSGKHVLKLVNLATSGHPRIYTDGFLTIR